MALICYKNNQRRFISSIYTVVRLYSQNVNLSGVKSSTVDSNEISFHSNLSKEWWNKNGPMKVLHSMNEIRIQFIRTGLINSGKIKERETFTNPLYLKGLTIGDIGCGGGILSLNLAMLGCKVIGVDPSKELIAVAKEAAQKIEHPGPIEFIDTSVEELVMKQPESLDALICSEVIEHVTNKEDFVTACVKLLKPGGSIFFTTLNRTIPARLLTIVIAEAFKIIPPGTHHYENFITHEELSAMLAKNGCETKMVNGLIYVPFNDTFYWIPYTTIEYALHAVKL